jgi:hypothetical protein
MRGFQELRDIAIVPVICPTCQNVFAGEASCQRALATLHGVVFDIFGLERESRRPCRWKTGLPSSRVY